MKILDRSDYWMVSGIYLITNWINGKVYIGSSNNLYERSVRHLLRIKGGKHDNPHLQTAMNKYGIENFHFFVMEECEPSKLIEREQFYIDIYKSYDRKVGYNCKRIANSSLGIKLSDRAKENLKKAHNNPKTKALHSLRSKERVANRSEEEKLAYSERMKNLSKKWHSDPEIKERSQAKRRKKYFVFSPDGDVFYTENIRLFCKNNGISYSALYSRFNYYEERKRIVYKSRGKQDRNRKVAWNIQHFDTSLITPQMKIQVA